MLSQFMKNGIKHKGKVHGLIVPHAGYAYSGKIAGGAYELLKGMQIDRAIVLGPSHYAAFSGLASLEEIKTPLGEMKIIPNDYKKVKYEHSIDNQIPFLQKLKVKEILPLVVGYISNEEAQSIAEQLVKENKDALFVFSSDLSHFFIYDEAVKLDNETIKLIEKLDLKNASKMDACGQFPLLIMMHLCKLKKYKPKLIEYKNSGDITGDKSSVVGYASFAF